jgi:hypothetical protein
MFLTENYEANFDDLSESDEEAFNERMTKFKK